MVEIRKLQPSIEIKLPERVVQAPMYRRTSGKSESRRTERRRRDHPPPTPQPTPCVLWQGSVSPDGYGRRKAKRPGTARPQTVGVHRWIVELYFGRKLHRDEVIMHLCDNRVCYRFDHLQVGTVVENNADRDAKGRLVHVAQHMHGTSNGRAKFSEFEVRAIRGAYEDGTSTAQLARDYRVARSTIYKIVQGITWQKEEQ